MFASLEKIAKTSVFAGVEKNKIFQIFVGFVFFCFFMFLCFYGFYG